MSQASDEALEKLRAFGLKYPEAHLKSPWPGHLDLAVRDKAFAFMSIAGEPFRISVKLPFTGEEVYTAKHLRDRKLQRALLQFFKPENYFEVREALLKAGRSDLIGSGCDALIPANPPKAALRARMEKANRSVTEGQYVHSIPGPNARFKPAPAPPSPQRAAGYRPARKSAKRRSAPSTRNGGPPRPCQGHATV